MKRGCGVVAPFAFPVFLALPFIGWTAWNVSVLGRTESTTGRVVDLVRSSDGDTFRPVVEFLDANGMPHRFQRTVGFGGDLVPDIGREWTVAYDPNDPSDARVIGIAFWIGPVLFAMATIVTTLVAVGILAVTRRSGRRLDGPKGVWTANGEEVEFRRVESDFTAAGFLRYRVVAETESGEQLFSDWLDEDPTAEFVQSPPRMRVVIRNGERTVDW